MATSLDLLAPDAARVEEEITALAAICEATTPGWTRRVFSEPYRDSRAWVHARMTAAGLETHEDGAGNLVGVRAGTHGGPALVTGSHTDTVHGGGRFDGIVGVLGAIEALRILDEADIQLRHDLRVIDFLGEEANDFGVSCIGSRAISGTLAPEHLDHGNGRNGRLGDALTAAGIDPNRALKSRWTADEVAAYLELHIEQGPLLERRGTAIGVVTSIAGIERLMATFLGRADHAGTMPMTERRDALAAAAAAVLAIEDVAAAAESAVATTGSLYAQPGVVNVVSARATIWSELRSADATWLGAAQRELAIRTASIARDRRVEHELEWLTDQPPVPTAQSMQDMIAATADELGLAWTPIPSGAGHDAAHMAALGPMGMIFVPSHDGRSHCPEEWTDTEDIVHGVRLLASTLVRLDTDR